MCVSTLLKITLKTNGTAPPRLSAAREEGWVLSLFEGCGLRFSQSEKSDSCPTAKPPSDAEHRFLPLPEAVFLFISVGTEMKRKNNKRAFGVLHSTKPFVRRGWRDAEGVVPYK